MIKHLIKSETRINTFNNFLSIELEEESSFSLDVNNQADFEASDAKFNNWFFSLNNQIKEYNLSQIKVNKENLLKTIENTQFVFDDLISSISNPVYFLELKIVKTNMFEDRIKVLFEINQYIIESANVDLSTIPV